MAAHRMTPARRAALKKAQAASARKRRGKGKGKLAAANRKISGGGVKGHLRRNAGNYVAGAALVAYGAAHVAHAYGKHKKGQAAAKKYSANSKKFYNDYAAHLKQDKKRRVHYSNTRPVARSRGATKHNRVFVASRHGSVSVRTRY
jgi:hypothetical protein